jgi:hypothetical protein
VAHPCLLDHMKKSKIYARDTPSFMKSLHERLSGCTWTIGANLMGGVDAGDDEVVFWKERSALIHAPMDT